MKPFLFSLCLLFFFGCEKATEYNSSPRDNFEALWRIMDENYCFFAFKDVDWDEVHDRYNLLVKDTMKIIRPTSIPKYKIIISARITRLPEA